MSAGRLLAAGAIAVSVASAASQAHAQRPPSASEVANYAGLLKAAHEGDLEAVAGYSKSPGSTRDLDGHGRSALHIAAYLGHHDVMRALVKAGADPNALEHDRYDIVTIAAVADDLPTLLVALELGASAGNVTSPYDGTALIAAAHLGHVDVVARLIRAGAPLDHVNNLGWTAVIESIVLGDGGKRHTETLRLLLAAGANPNIADRHGTTPLQMARSHGYETMEALLLGAGGK